MSEASAFRAAFSDFRIVRTRKVALVVLEVPIEAADAALYALGGLPNPAAERWVAVARLNDDRPSAEPAAMIQAGRPTIGTDEAVDTNQGPRPFSSLSPSVQAGIRCNEPEFRKFLRNHVSQVPGYSMPDDAATPEGAAQFVRAICGVSSRAMLNTNEEARERWTRLENEFWAWSRGRRT